MAIAQKRAAKAKQASPAKKVTPVADKPKPKNLEPHEIVTSSSIQNAVGIAAWGKFAGEVDLQALVKDLGEQTVKVQDGDMRPVEGMLFRQAKTLETMFTNLTRRASQQENMKWFQTYLTLSLKAQAQCRSTLEALAEIKNPRSVQFVRQANMTTGPQQVNNGAILDQNARARARAGDFQTKPNKLLEANHGQRLDIGAKDTASRVNKTVEAMG